jgi:hypothetical protein
MLYPTELQAEGLAGLEPATLRCNVVPTAFAAEYSMGDEV